MTKVPSPLRAPAEIQSVHASTPTSHSNSRCKDCGAPLDVWNSCPNIPASEARLRSSVQGPAYCGRRPPSGRLWNFAVDMLGVGRVLGCGQILRGAASLKGLLDGNLNVTLSHLHILQLQDFTEVEGKRDRLFCELLFAARDLAARNITRETRTRICRECGMVAEPSEHLPHSGSPIRRHSVA
jgi:hypothetical protein